MQKHPNITASTLAASSAHCSFTNQVLMVPMPVSRYAFRRHLTKAALIKSPFKNVLIKEYLLPCGCYLTVHPSGVRELYALPF